MTDSGSGSGGARNRLAGEISPYLLLHQSNPVDWYPWGEEALERARKDDKPIFLSVGYSTCYWCHVMERESFSDPQVAELMNRDFVNVKLDREERPDLDEIYMAATQILTQQGGWPNSVFLTPQLVPYFAGTYFPPEGRHGLPSFRQVLESMAAAWRDRRDDVETQAQELEGAMRRFLEERGAPKPTVAPASVAEKSLESLEKRFDATWGGFGSAPKFPSPGNLFLLLDLADERPEAGRMLTATLDHMARGGIYDQLGGGFHRYATDREWKIPHFEKMLYDNGMLLELYAREYERTADPEMARIVRETAEFLDREMTAPEGGFWSAIDAETHGHEGAYYVWTLEELEAVLGAEDAGFLATLYGYDRAPFFEGSHYVLHLPLPIPEQAQRRRTTPEELLEQIAPLRERLMESRDGRERPPTDDKILADWNGMAITGLATAGRTLAEPELVERAARAGEFVWDHLRAEDGPLMHSWRAGQAKNPAYLSDYVFLTRGYLELFEAAGESLWLERAAALGHEMIERLADARGGFFVAGEQDDVLFRSREVFDGALPSTNAMAVSNLLHLARSPVEGPWLETAEAVLKAFAGIIEQSPEGARMLTVVNRRFHQQAGAQAEAPAEVETDSEPSTLEAEALAVVTPRLELEEAPAEDWRGFSLHLEVDDGWHLYAPGASEPGTSEEVLQAVELTARDAEIRLSELPEGVEADGAEVGGAEVGRTRVYRDRITLEGSWRPAGEEARLVLRYQPCDASRCLPAVEREIALSTAS